jgi:16S rRNA (adenine1518-N6/adenine1519-N6)-dimethyltransferase
VRARKRFGQHFLAPAWADKVVDAIAPAPGDRFLEIGPGSGALTLRLAPRVAHLTAVEVDRDLARDLAPRLPSNAEVVTADFLEFDPAPLVAGGPLRVAGNLPYNISSPILFRLLQFAGSDHLRQGCGGREDPAYLDATLMLQREVADRLAARPGTKDYGVLTIFTTVQADVERVLTLPPGAFRPAPKVHSAVVRLTFRPHVVPGELRDVFARMVRSMFTQRRKTLGNALRPFGDSAGQPAAVALKTAGIDPGRRPETLSLTELVALAGAFRAPGLGPRP